MPTRRIELLGIPIDDVTLDEAVAAIGAMIDSGEPHQVTTLNPELVIATRRNGAFRRVVRASALVVPDGFGLLVGARLMGERLRARVTGSQLVEALAAAAVQRGWSLFLLGAAPGVAEQAAAALQSRHPGLRIAGCYAGSPRTTDEPLIHARIRAARPSMLLVAYGAPAQELWIARAQPLVRVPVAINVGGVFDFLAGRVARAPDWMQRLGLEWLFRLVKQPRRWRRILTAVIIFPLAVLRSRWEMQVSRIRRTS